ncbi:hypothetical protein PHMEG_00026927 [Phytophthora megakarya]|uniref:Reverse transcriptase domain-containing protein n=1 Tax=Phytophthora megakarya TaxID=4795 RepID=A0A225V773_9STRA|nr:hypothetical protein PHMEG_00026927 [Phytophthora megakarya]
MSGHYVLDADGDVDMTVAQPIYEFISALRLKSWDPPPWSSKWSRNRAHYESQMRARCAVTAETYENVCVTVRGSMLLEMLENVAKYILGKLSREVTDNDLRGLIRARCETMDGGCIPDMKIDDAEARVLTYFQDFNKLVQENRLDDRALYKLIVEQAKLQHKFHKQTQELKVQRDDPKRSTPAPKEKKEGPKEKKSAGQAPEPSRTPSASSPRNGCLSCKGPHWVKCPNLTEARRKEMLDRLQEKKNKPPGGGGSRALHVALDAGDEESTQVLLNGIELQVLQPELQVKYLPTPVATSLADGTKVSCTTSALLNLQLVTSAGIVNMSGVECLVMPTSREEVFLGNTTLQSLGINADQQLARLAQTSTIIEEVDEFPAIEYGYVDHTAIGEMKNLRELLKTFWDTWRDKLGPDPPAKVAPLKITLREDAVPYRCQARKYPPAQRHFLQAYTRELVNFGFVRHNDKSRWACAAVPVRKVGSADSFRITNYYRPVNKETVSIAGVMPNLDVALDQVSGSYGFAKFDLMKGFWQMPLHPDSQELMSFMTEDSVFTLLRVPQDAMDSSVHFQNQLQDGFRELLERHCLIWIDDIIV